VSLLADSLEALFSEAMDEEWRVRDPVEPREGRCCQDNVPARIGIAALGVCEICNSFEGG